MVMGDANSFLLVSYNVIPLLEQVLTLMSSPSPSIYFNLTLSASVLSIKAHVHIVYVSTLKQNIFHRIKILLKGQSKYLMRDCKY